MEKTLLERVAQVIRDLETVWVITKDDKREFSLSETEKQEAYVSITLERSLHSKEYTEKEVKTIKACFEQEFQNVLFETSKDSSTGDFKAVEKINIEVTIS